jgi:serine/threonine protein kinase
MIWEFVGYLAISAVVVATIYLAARIGSRSHLRRRLRRKTCPNPADLWHFLNGSLTEKKQPAIAEHLERCETCQVITERMLAGKGSWPSMAERLRKDPPTHEMALRHAMDSLKAESTPESQKLLPILDGLALDFLSPSDKPGYLGRLGSYEVLELIGRGGCGVVLKAHDPALNRIVAIKALAPHFASSATARRRFTREAQAAAAVSHDHIVTIHAVDEANGLPYLVMQYVDGMSLQDRIDKSGPLELKEILRIGMQTASGLAAAHAQGLVHRDIKPANILLENGIQRVKITDFGLARAADEASLTQSGVVAGTPQYMAPEQARGETLDHRADLFSLGSVLYAMCTGLPPFRATTTMGVLKKVSDDVPKPIREINPEIPDWLVAVIDKLHAKDPADRYQSATEVGNVLGEHLARLQQAAWTPLPEATPKVTPVVPDTPTPPITSLTICPSCGSQLHVPEKMIGRTVECPQCSKPFQVADGSQEIQVVPPGKLPVLRPKRPRVRHAWVWVALGMAMLLFCCGIPLGLLVPRWSAVPTLDSAATVEEVTSYADHQPRLASAMEAAGYGDDVKSRLQGTWTVDVIEVDPKLSVGRTGMELLMQSRQMRQELVGPEAGADALWKATITFEGAMFTSPDLDPRLKSGGYRLIPESFKKAGGQWVSAIDLLPDSDKQHHLGIYEFRGNSVWMCFSTKQRPWDFTASPGSGNMVLRLQRENKRDNK